MKVAARKNMVIKSSTPYSEKVDKISDKKMTKGMTPAQKKKFMALDAKHKKVKTMGQDWKIDRKIVKKVKATKKGMK
jgi:hypothetical protein